MIADSHPYWHLRTVVADNPSIESISFSHYAYLPQTVDDTRFPLQVPAKDFLDLGFVEQLFRSTPNGHELAVHSDMLLADGSRSHLLMVDMATSAKAHLEKLRTFLGDDLFQRIVWFDSGRSFHGYGQDLLSERRWVEFMGLLLLANQPRLEPTVDPRWIGHRLMAGYAALRWTRNTPQYLVLPSRIEKQRASGRSLSVGPLGRRFGR